MVADGGDVEDVVAGRHGAMRKWPAVCGGAIGAAASRISTLARASPPRASTTEPRMSPEGCECAGETAKTRPIHANQIRCTEIEYTARGRMTTEGRRRI